MKILRFYLYVGSVLWAILSATVQAKYVTQPDFEIPELRVSYQHDSISPADGFIFVCPRVEGPRGLMIFDKNLKLIYLNNSKPTIDALYYRPFDWGNDQLIVYHYGDARTGHSNGSAVILNQDYTLNTTIKTKYHVDGHEFRPIEDGYALATSYEDIPNVPIGSAGNANIRRGWLTDSCFQEVNMKDEKDVRFRFCPHKHLPLDLAYNDVRDKPTTRKRAWDWFHMNAVNKDALGNYMFSSRNTHTIYYVDGRTKSVIWQLGGKESNFTGDGNDFSWQHSVRHVGENGLDAKEVEKRLKNGKRYISLFDNASAGFSKSSERSKGVIIELDFKHMKATIQHKYLNPGGEKGLLADSQGSLQLLSEEPRSKSNHVMMGYGSVPLWAEFTYEGKTVQAVWFGEQGKVQAYEVYKKAWRGFPATKPDVAVKKNTLYVSWNGATEVDHWVLESSKGANEPDKEPKIDKIVKNDFEVGIPLDTNYSLFRVLAATKDDCILAKSDYITKKGKNRGGGEKGKNYAREGMADICPKDKDDGPKKAGGGLRNFNGGNKKVGPMFKMNVIIPAMVAWMVMIRG